jgi:hypothetical protein
MAIAAQIRSHDMKPLGKPRRHRVPGNMRQRVAVQQEQRRSAAAMSQANAGSARLDVASRRRGSRLARSEFAADPPLEETGFELLLPVS